MKTLMSYFSNVERAADAMAALLDHGVSETNMDLVANSSYGEMLVERKQNVYAEKAKSGVTTTTTADAADGAKKGGLAGLATGVIAGLASLVIPGYGIVLGGGALATALGAAVGTGAAGMAAGGITGYLKDMGAEEKVALEMEEGVKNGGGVLTITASHQASPGIREILHKYRADTIVEA